MKRIGCGARLLALFLPLALGAPVQREGAASPAISPIERAIAALPRTARIGISVISLPEGRTIVEVDPDRSMIPASVTKIFTASAALSRLGPGFRFKTRVFADAPVAPDGSVETLYLVGSGDPSLVSEELWRLVHNLYVETGLRAVRKRIVLDDTYFDREWKPEAWGGGNPLRAYTAPVGALSFNFNAVRFLIGPAPSSPVALRWDPPSAYLEVESRLRPGKGTRISFERRERLRGDRYIVTGTWGRGRRRKTYYRSISKPTWYTGRNFAEFLAREGIEVPERLERGRVPGGATLLLEHESKDLASIVRDMGKFSNNFTAEHLLKALGAEVFSPPGTTGKGLRALSAYLTSIGIAGGFHFADGSGLSRENRVSARQVTTLLRRAGEIFELAPEFISLLPVAGIDGTLRTRMTASLAGKVRAKTGSLKGVDTLAGYFVTPGGEHFAFAILVNGSPSRARNLAVIDEIVARLTQVATAER